MKKLYFIRHGLSVLNVKGLYAGRTETPLTKEGKQQSKIAGLAARKLNIDLIVSSPMNRALETARIIANEINYPTHRIITDNRLVERDFGILEAMPWSPDHSYQYKLQYGAENDKQLLKRTQEFLKWLKTQKAENILIVGHGASGRALRSLIKKDFPMSSPRPLTNAVIYEWI